MKDLDKEEILEGNNIIAKAMGFKKIPETKFYTIGTRKHKLAELRNVRPSITGDGDYVGCWEYTMLFHSDWNWTMAALKEFYKLDEGEDMDNLTSKFDVWEQEQLFRALVKFAKKLK